MSEVQTIAKDLGFSDAAIQKLSGAQLREEAGQLARLDRDYKIFSTLKDLKNLAGEDREKYLAGVCAKAYEEVNKHKADLIRLNELRAQNTPESNAAAAQLLKDNPSLIEARAYLVLGMGSAVAGYAANEDAKKLFSEFANAERDSSAINLCNVIVQATSDPNAKCEDLYNLHVNACKAQIKTVLEYLYNTKLDDSELGANYYNPLEPGALDGRFPKRGTKISGLGRGLAVMGNPAVREGFKAVGAGTKTAYGMGGVKGVAALRGTIAADAAAASRAAGAAKGVGAIASKAAAPLAVVGAGIEGYSAFQEEQVEGKTVVQSATVGAGAFGGTLGGGILGMKAGAVIGSMIAPGVGTVIGGVIGAVGGAIIGSKLGRSIGQALSSVSLGGMKSACSRAWSWLLS